MQNFETFGARLKRLRVERGISYREFGKRIASAASTVALYQNGERTPGYWVLCEMAKVLDVSLDYLMVGREYEKGRYPAGARASADRARELV